MKLEHVQKVNWVMKELRPIARKISNLDLRACNYENTEREDKRREKLLEQAGEIAQYIGLKVYHQGDPRGLSLYLIDETMNWSNYFNGVAIQ